MKERRFTPYVSSTLHRQRHSAHQRTDSERTIVRALSDLTLVEKVSFYSDKDDVWLSTRTLARIRRRLYIQEAARRGLWKGDE